MGLLALDFGAVASRLNRSPRLLGFLVNRDGTYLADPDPSRVLSRRGNAPLDRAFEQLLAQPIDSGRPAEVKLLENLTLPGLTVYAASARFTTAPEPGRLRQARNNLVTKYPDLRMGRVDDAPDRIVFRAADQETIRLALRDLRGLLDVPVEADEPYKCETFFARLLLVRPEAPPVRPAGQSGPAPPPPWFGLALAAAHEEIEHDIVTDYWKNFLFSAMLAAAAGCGMLAFAVVMTGSLRRMTAYAERRRRRKRCRG